jgi:hypothetical protein
MSNNEKINHPEGTPGWLELYDLSLHPDMEARSPHGAYIKGIIKANNYFSPTSEILGYAIPKPTDIDTMNGWVEIETLRFHGDIEAVAQTPPYVCGDIDRDRHFYPREPYALVYP